MKHFTTFGAIAVGLTVLAVNLAQAQLPDPGLEIDRERTAVVITDPQNDFLSPDGVTWGLVGKSVTANGTVANIEALMKTAKKEGLPVFVSPHYYFPTDDGWKFGGAVETMMHAIDMFRSTRSAFESTIALNVSPFRLVSYLVDNCIAIWYY